MLDFVYMALLYDFYGALLTEKQQESIRLHVLEDFSLTEVGETLGISRQAAYDNIRRGEKAMEDYEARLGLVHRYRRERAALRAVEAALETLRTEENTAAVDEILGRIKPLMQ